MHFSVSRTPAPSKTDCAIPSFPKRAPCLTPHSVRSTNTLPTTTHSTFGVECQRALFYDHEHVAVNVPKPPETRQRENAIRDHSSHATPSVPLLLFDSQTASEQAKQAVDIRFQTEKATEHMMSIQEKLEKWRAERA